MLRSAHDPIAEEPQNLVGALAKVRRAAAVTCGRASSSAGGLRVRLRSRASTTGQPLFTRSLGDSMRAALRRASSEEDEARRSRSSCSECSDEGNDAIPKVHVSAALVLALAISASVLARTFVDDFSTMPAGTCYPDGTAAGVWRFVYNGYGCTALCRRVAMRCCSNSRPRPPRRTKLTRALVLGPAIAGDFTLTVSTATTRQLRTG